MGNMSYCRFENTARDLGDCVEALLNKEAEELSHYELNEYELEGLEEILFLAQEIVDDHDFIKEIIEDYE